jgi:hypothetical protein
MSIDRRALVVGLALFVLRPLRLKHMETPSGRQLAGAR